MGRLQRPSKGRAGNEQERLYRLGSLDRKCEMLAIHRSGDFARGPTLFAAEARVQTLGFQVRVPLERFPIPMSGHERNLLDLVTLLEQA